MSLHVQVKRNEMYPWEMDRNVLEALALRFSKLALRPQLS